MGGVLPEFVDFAHELAALAGEVIRPLFRTEIAVYTKADATPVTRADRDAEQAMREAIMRRYPDHGIWGEEFGRHLPDAKYTWVLDPVDGTRAFIAGRPTFGTLISLTRLGVPILGVIDQPITGERWVGHGAGTELNSKRCAVRPCASLEQAVLSTTSSTLFDPEGKAKFAAVQAQVKDTVYGLDCYAYAQLASGAFDLVIESGLKPHDFCALRPVIEGAGGIMTDWQGNPLTLASDGNVIAAGDKRVYHQSLALLK